MPGWFRGRRPRSDLHVVMFTRQGCHLCDEAWALLQRYQETHGFTLEAKDVDSSPEWIDAYGEWVPVVLINDKVRFRGRINEVLLRRELNAP